MADGIEDLSLQQSEDQVKRASCCGNLETNALYLEFYAVA